MLRDIEQEVVFTRREIGKDALDERVLAAMAKAPRERFIPEPYRSCAFSNGPVPIGHGQTISQPGMVALMTDLLDPRPDSTVLELGTGSGYQAAVLAEIVQHVYSVEIVGALAETARERLQGLGYGNVTVRIADGYYGWPEQAPFEGIIVTTAAAPNIPPPLIEQLKPEGRLIIPVGEPGDVQTLTIVEKGAKGCISSRNVLLVAFVPLTGAPN